ncbi:MAG TPA: hypothetical protein VJ783_03065 [Pirellulales bacterium]|nr:hypothetical protein [Pirellulales bacterium]
MTASELHPPEPNPYASPVSELQMPLAWTSGPVIESLRQTRPWVLLFSILGFIGTAIVSFIGFCQAALAFTQGSPQKAGEAMGGGLVTLLFGVLYFFPSMYLLRYAARIRDLTRSQRLADLEAALSAQKSFWRFCGIVAVLLLTLYALILVGIVAMSIFAAVRT